MNNLAIIVSALLDLARNQEEWDAAIGPIRGVINMVEQRDSWIRHQGEAVADFQQQGKELDELRKELKKRNR